jgi:hypothetical protein
LIQSAEILSGKRISDPLGQSRHYGHRLHERARAQDGGERVRRLFQATDVPSISAIRRKSLPQLHVW